MRPVPPWKLWIGHAGDTRDLPRLRAAGVAALVDLAMEEPPALVGRELIYCRLPLTDGGGNPLPTVRASIDTIAALVRSGTPTLVCCSAGMSRSPSVTAGALALLTGQLPEDCLRLVIQSGPADISGGMWRQVLEALSRTSWLHRLTPPPGSQPPTS